MSTADTFSHARAAASVGHDTGRDHDMCRPMSWRMHPPVSTLIPQTRAGEPGLGDRGGSQKHSYSKKGKISSGHSSLVFPPDFSAFGIDAFLPSFPQLILLPRPTNGYCSPSLSLASSSESGTLSPKSRLISWV